MFVSVNDEHHVDSDINLGGWKIVNGWDQLDFFYMVVAIEHAVLFLKWSLQKFIDDVPNKIQQGERDKQSLI